MKLEFIVVFLLLIVNISRGEHMKNFTERFTWKRLEFGFHSPSDRQHAIDTGHYSDPNRFPVDVGVAYITNKSMKVFLTLPRFARESAYSLAIVSDEVGPNGPKIYPYPSYGWQNNDNRNCSAITSAHRVAITNCNQMFVIDSGVIKGKQVCPPQLFVFNLKDNSLIHRFEYPSNLYTSGASVFSTVIVDTADPAPVGKCERNMVYVADSQKYGIVVYDQQRKAAWRIENKLMAAEKQWENYTIAGESFIWSCGIYALNISPRKLRPQNAGRNLFFHALSSDKEVAVDLNVINNKEMWEKNPKASPDAFQIVASRGVQSFMEAVDSKGNLYASTADPLSVFVWNVYNPIETYNTSKIVGDNPSELQFVSGMKVAQQPDGEDILWLLSARDQKFETGTFNPNETNFRVIYARTRTLLERVVPWLAKY